jgi:hypothetical protein
VRLLHFLKVAQENRHWVSPWVGPNGDESQTPLDFWTSIFAVLDTSTSSTPFPCGLGGSSEEMVWISLSLP